MRGRGFASFGRFAMCTSLVALLAGCAEDDPKPPTPTPTPVPETCSVVAMTPDFGAASVDVGTTITISFNQPIDFASVEGHAIFQQLGGELVEFDAAQSGDSTIVLTPKNNLRFWGEYSVDLGDVTTLDGKTCEPASAAFATIQPEAAAQPTRAAAISGATKIDATHLLVASTAVHGFQVYDVTDPSAPVLQSELRTEINPLGVALDPDQPSRAYAPAGYDGVLILDVSSPTEPVVLGVAGTPGVALQIVPFTRDGVAYLAIADASGGLRFVDVSDPEGPKDVSALAIASGATALAMQGSMFATVDGAGQFELIDATNLAAPALLSTTSPAAVTETFNSVLPANRIAFLGDKVAISQFYAGFQTFDITNPSAPVFLDHMLGPQGQCPASCADTLFSLVADGGKLFAASAMTGAVRVAVAPNGVLSTEATLVASGRINSVFATGTELFVGGDAGLYVFDENAADGAPALYAEKNGWGVDRGIAVRGGELYVASSSRGLETYSLNAPLSPAPQDLQPTPGVEVDYGLENVFPSGDLLYVADGRAGISVFSMQNPLKPVNQVNIPIPDNSDSLVINGQYVYTCAGNNGLRVLDMSLPATPVEVQTLDIGETLGQCGALHLVGTTLYIAGGNGLGIVDTTVPNQLTVAGVKVLPAEDVVLSIDHRGDRLFGTTYVHDWEGVHYSAQRLLVFDISDRTHPTRTFKSDDLSGARKVAVRGDKAFITARDRGVIVFDISQPDEPFLEGTIDMHASTYWPAFGEDTLYVSQLGSGVGAVHLGAMRNLVEP